mgnify:CR=1 FL=1
MFYISGGMLNWVKITLDSYLILIWWKSCDVYFDIIPWKTCANFLYVCLWSALSLHATLKNSWKFYLCKWTVKWVQRFFAAPYRWMLQLRAREQGFADFLPIELWMSNVDFTAKAIYVRIKMLLHKSPKYWMKCACAFRFTMRQEQNGVADSWLNFNAFIGNHEKQILPYCKLGLGRLWILCSRLITIQ